VIELLRGHVLAWTTSAAFTLTMAQVVAPSFMDWILDFLVVGLVALAAKLARSPT
jgi:hypothetical protein